MALLCVTASAASGFAQPQPTNLLSNPGFEQAPNGKPSEWFVYVQPENDADATLETTGASEGKNCVLLRTAKPYDTEPFNNWSQNVSGDFVGKDLVAKGLIKTEEATEASVWLQCWSKNPWRLIKGVSSATDFPLAGTQAWTPVEVRMKAPAGTDYVTLRCVLKGIGKAWFDDLSLVEEAKKEEAALAKPLRPTPPAKPISTTVTIPERSPRKLPQIDAAGLLKAPLGSTAGPVSDDSVRELVRANRVLAEGYQALRETNAALAEQIQSLQKEVRTLRRQLQQKAAVPPPAAPPPQEKPEKKEEVKKEPAAETPADPGPPLVPSGEKWQGR